jgi:hypothetical protein
MTTNVCAFDYPAVEIQLHEKVCFRVIEFGVFLCYKRVQRKWKLKESSHSIR